MKIRPLIGPVLFYDLVCSARRTRFILVRVLYAGVLFVVLIWVAYSGSPQQRFGPRANPAEQAARMAELFFSTLLTVQMLAVLVLTPAYTAGAIAEEKERRTLEFVLATDLANREIVLSKLLSRLANLALLLLTGLPILSLMQFLGGIDPGLLLAGFAATGITMTSLAGVSILLSVHARRSRDAIGLMYLGTAVYLGLTFLAATKLRDQFPAVGALGLPVAGRTVTLLDVAEAAGTGNIFLTYRHLNVSLGRGSRLADVLPNLLGTYAVFHLVVTVVCVTWAVARLRAVALKQAAEPATGTAVFQRLRLRPAVGRRPMIWKELYAEPGLRLGRLGRIVVLGFVLLSFVPAVGIIIDYLQGTPSGWGRPGWRVLLSARINDWVRMLTMIVSCLLLLGVAVRAAGSVSGERDRQTFDPLLTTPLDSDAILFAKWLGSIASVRRGWLWLGLLWFAGVLLGGLHVVAVLELIALWMALAGLLAAIGLNYSMTCRKTTRATVATVMTALFLGGGHWLVMGLCFYLPLGASRTINESYLSGIAEFEYFGLTPPISFQWLAFQGREPEWHHEKGWRSTLPVMTGMLVWAVAAALVYYWASRRFRVVTRRAPLKQPHRPIPDPDPLGETVAIIADS